MKRSKAYGTTRPARRSRGPHWQVHGCGNALEHLREYHRRYKICEVHQKQTRVLIADKYQRFCQQCGRFHELDEFDGDKRSCRTRLQRHNARRRKKTSATARARSYDDTEEDASTEDAEQSADHSPASNQSAVLVDTQRKSIIKASEKTSLKEFLAAQGFTKDLLPFYHGKPVAGTMPLLYTTFPESPGSQVFAGTARTFYKLRGYMEDDDALYSKLFGEAAPESAPLQSLPSQKVLPVDSLPARPSLNANGSNEMLATSHSGTASQAKTAPKLLSTQNLANSEKEFDDEEDEDFDVRLDQPEADEDDLDIKLDGQDDAHEVALRNATPGLSPSVEPRSQSKTSALPLGDTPTSASGASKTAGNAGNPSSRIQAVPPQRPFQYPEYDPNNPGVLPSQTTGPEQRIRLPGQTRVTPDEYKEFLSLGHGDIFNLDLDWVVDAPWRLPGADQSDFFNYGMNTKTWKEYCAKIKVFQQELNEGKHVENLDRPRWGDRDRDRDRDRPKAEEHRNGGASQPSGHRDLNWNGRPALEDAAGADHAEPSHVAAIKHSGSEDGDAVGSLPMPGTMSMHGLPLPPMSQDWNRGEPRYLSQRKKSKWDAG